MRLVWRVFLANTAVITAAVLALALTPATVSFPIGRLQAVELAVGTAVLLLIDLWVLRRAFQPFEQLVAFMRRVDPLQPGARVTPATGDPDVLAVAASVNEMLDRLEQERRESGRRQLGAQEAERRRVARDLHDEVGQLLTATLLQLDRVEATAGTSPALVEARAATDAALDEVRAISRRLRPLVLDDLGLADALAVLCSSVATRGDIRIVREVRAEDLSGLNADEEVVIYRIVQESLTNAVKHAGARSVVVGTRVEDDVLEVRIADDGRGARPFVEGAGIRGMRERALLVSGRFEIRPAAAGGSEVVLTLPRGADGSRDPLPAPVA